MDSDFHRYIPNSHPFMQPAFAGHLIGHTLQLKVCARSKVRVKTHPRLSDMNEFRVLRVENYHSDPFIPGEADGRRHHSPRRVQQATGEQLLHEIVPRHVACRSDHGGRLGQSLPQGVVLDTRGLFECPQKVEHQAT